MSHITGKNKLPRFNWKIRESDPLSAKPKWQALNSRINCNPLLARVLVARGLDTIDEAKEFLNPGRAHILPPAAIPGLEKARDRLLTACQAKEAVLVHGDYDADGIIGASILHATLKNLGCKSRIFIPSRETHGYGLAMAAIEMAKAAGIGLLVTVDCGISSHESVEAAVEAGIEVIVTDHHEIPDRLPSGACLVHPELEGDYIGGKIAGAAVAWKLAVSLVEASGGNADEVLERYLPLTAVATVADVCPLTKENRSIVALGLRQVPDSKIPGLRVLFQGTRRDNQEGPITARDVAFGMAPVLNAAGRMGDPLPAAKLLLAKDEKTAWQHLRKLQEINKIRRRTQDEICRRLKRLPEAAWGEAGILAIVDEHCTAGLAGLAAARLVDETGRPTFVLAPGKDEHGPLYRGSMRRAGAEHLVELMAPAAEFTEKIGGHAGALGLTVRPDKLDRFLTACSEIKWDPLPSELELDFLYEDGFSNVETVQALDATRPWGEGNPQPAFAWGPVIVKGTRMVGKDNSHIQVSLSGPDGNICKGIGFSMSGLFPEDGGVGRSGVAAGHFMINNWQGMESVEFQLRDLEFD